MCLGVPLFILWLFMLALEPGLVAVVTACAVAVVWVVQSVLDRLQ